jgi:hypothetical protein
VQASVTAATFRGQAAGTSTNPVTKSAITHGTPGPLAAIGAVINIIAGVLALIAVAFVIRGADERFDTPTSRSIAD